MNESEGFVIEYRKIMEWEWYTDVNTAHLFRHCILKANYKDTVWRGIEVKRGSFVTSLQHLSVETGLTVKQVRTSLEKLEKTGEVANKSTSKYRIITVNNYSQYQIEGKQNGNQKGKQKANKGQTEGKQRATTNKYISNDIYNKENKVSAAPQGRADTEQGKSAVSGSPLGATASAATKKDFDYDEVDWSVIQTFPKDTKDILWGHISYKPIIRFARSVGIDDYDADRFYSAFKLSKTILPQDWENVLYKYSQADREKQKEFEDRMMSGEYKDKWNR